MVICSSSSSVLYRCDVFPSSMFYQACPFTSYVFVVNIAALLCIFSILFMLFIVYRSHTELPYSKACLTCLYFV